MEDFFLYPPHSDLDLKWGMVLTALGKTRIPPHSPYPLFSHPKSYRFSPQQTRSVSEYQIIYITDGAGYFKSEPSGSFKISSGTIFLLFPQVAHSYHPKREIGWTEYYVGINGHMMDELLKGGWLSKSKPVFEIGVHENLIKRYQEIFNLSKSGKSGWHQAATGAVWHLLGEILYLTKNNDVDSETEQLIQNIKAQITERYSTKIDWEELCRLNGVSYSKMRKTFKSYMGMSPGEYQQQLRINQAKVLLSQSLESIRQIALSVGFQNEFYFNSAFKKRTGVTPGVYRNRSYLN